MLLAVEGGGFFSSSASGYSKGLALLILGRTSDEQHKRVAPWSHYQLVDKETGSDLQLASGKNRVSRGCASFVCFGRASAGLDGQLPLKVGPTQPQDVLPDGPEIERDKDLSTTVQHDNYSGNIALKSSLKKPLHNTPQTAEKVAEQEPFTGGGKDLKSSLKKPLHNTTQTAEKGAEQELLTGGGKDLPGLTERRKVQWMDTYGKELAEIREFELSEAGGSDDELMHSNGKTCSCRIM